MTVSADPLRAPTSSEQKGAPALPAPAPAAGTVVATQPDYDKAFRQLCHIVAITKDGKEELAIDNLVVTALALDPDLSRDDESVVSGGIESYFAITIAPGRIRQSLDRSIRNGVLVRTATGLTVSPSARADVEERAAAAAALERQVQAEWRRSEPLVRAPEELQDRAWAALQRFMAYMFRRHGAETILLLDPTVAAANLSGSLSQFMTDALSDAAVASEETEAVREAIRGFFNSTTASRTRYVAQLLDGTFTFFALSLDEATSSFLRESLPPLKVFLDTNFIFGLVGLNDDELNGVAQELIKFIQSNHFPFQLYYHEKTLDELQRTLDAIGQRLTSQRWTRALSAAAIQAGTVSTAELRYHRLNAVRESDPDAFMARYGHVQPLLEGLGLKIYREPREDKTAEERRWGLVAEYNEFKKARRPDRPRRYEALDHDVSVWTSVQRLRAPARSALRSGAILLSADHLLYRFDWGVKREHRTGGSVVLPSQLLQLLRPFVALNPDFDRRFVQTFSIPEFRTSTTNYTQAASKALSYMASLKDLPQPTAVAILRDELLLRKLDGEREGSTRFRTQMDAAIVQKNRSLQAENSRLQKEIKDFRTSSRATDRTASATVHSSQEEGLTTASQSARLAGPAVTTRVSALVVDGLLVSGIALLAVLEYGWLNAVGSTPGSLITSVGRSIVGGIGVLACAYAFLIFRFGVIAADPEYLVAPLRHATFRAAGLTAVGAGLLVFWRLQ